MRERKNMKLQKNVDAFEWVVIYIKSDRKDKIKEKRRVACKKSLSFL